MGSGAILPKSHLDVLPNHSVRRCLEAFSDVLEATRDMFRLELNKVQASPFGYLKKHNK